MSKKTKERKSEKAARLAYEKRSQVEKDEREVVFPEADEKIPSGVVFQKVEVLDRSLSKLGDRLSDLQERLFPILSQSNPSKAGEREGVDHLPPLAVRLSSMIEKVGILVEGVDDLIERVEL